MNAVDPLKHKTYLMPQKEKIGLYFKKKTDNRVRNYGIAWR